MVDVGHTTIWKIYTSHIAERQMGVFLMINSIEILCVVKFIGSINGRRKKYDLYIMGFT